MKKKKKIIIVITVKKKAENNKKDTNITKQPKYNKNNEKYITSE